MGNVRAALGGFKGVDSGEKVLERAGTNYRCALMALNPDPKPGRWVLPLVVLGMVAFTYFFVRALPAGTDNGTTDTTVSATDTTLAGENGTTATTTTAPGSTDPGSVDGPTQAYLDGVTGILTTMEELQREMAAVNGGFDADPREIEYADAVDRLRALAEQAEGLVTQLDELTPPDSLSTNHETIRTAVTGAAAAAEEALAGLQSTDEGGQRRDAAEAFDSAVADLQTAVGNARSAAGLSSPTTDTTEPAEDTTDTTEGATTTTEGG